MARLLFGQCLGSALFGIAALHCCATAYGRELLRAEARAFETEAEIEILTEDVERGRGALLAAIATLEQTERLLRPNGDAPGGLGALNAMAGAGPHSIDQSVYVALFQSLAFCQWSRQSHGPLGGHLYADWGLRQPVQTLPESSSLREHVRWAGCEQLKLDSSKLSAELGRGARLDLWGFERGFAVDRIVEVMGEHGITSGWVRIGFVIRGFGPGPEARGWPVSIDPSADDKTETERIFLRDQAIAMASRREAGFLVAGKLYPAYLDQRTGLPAEDKVAVLVVTERALDAEGLATALFVLSSREGEFRLGDLQPAPSVRWYLGSGEGYPLLMERRWSLLETWQAPRLDPLQ